MRLSSLKLTLILFDRGYLQLLVDLRYADDGVISPKTLKERFQAREDIWQASREHSIMLLDLPGFRKMRYASIFQRNYWRVVFFWSKRKNKWILSWHLPNFQIILQKHSAVLREFLWQLHNRQVLHCSRQYQLCYCRFSPILI